MKKVLGSIWNLVTTAIPILLAVWAIRLQIQANESTSNIDALEEIVTLQSESVRSLENIVKDQNDQLTLDRERNEVQKNQLEVAMNSFETSANILSESLKQSSSLKQLETLGATPKLDFSYSIIEMHLEPILSGDERALITYPEPIELVKLVLQNQGGLAKNIRLLKKERGLPEKEIESYFECINDPLLEDFLSYNKIERNEKHEKIFQSNLLQNLRDTVYFSYLDELNKQYIMKVNYSIEKGAFYLDADSPIKFL